VLRYDLFGRGYSDRPDVTYDARSLSAVGGLLDALAFTTVDLVGLSVGGSVAASFTIEHPQRVRRLVLMDPAPSSPPPFSARILSAPLLGDYFLPSSAPSFYPRARNRLPSRGKYAAGLPGAVQGPDDVSRVHPRNPLTIRNLYRRVHGRLCKGGEQQRPIMLIWGREDTTVPFADSDTIRKLMRRRNSMQSPMRVTCPTSKRPPSSSIA